MSPALPEAAPEGVCCAVRFMLDADVAPGLLPRLLQPFAKRDLVPDRMWSHRARDVLHVEIAMDAMPGEFVHLVEGNLRQVVGVHSVTRVAEPGLRQAA
jgi:hypothetical protein